MKNIDFLPSKNSVDKYGKELLKENSFFSGRVIIYKLTSCTESILVPFTKDSFDNFREQQSRRFKRCKK